MSRNSAKFRKLLKYSGHDSRKSFPEWMFQDQSGHNYALLNWLSENVSKDNVLSVTEQREYAELLKNGSLLSENDLQNYTKEVLVTYPELYFTAEDEENLVEQIDIINKQADLLEKQAVLLKTINSNLADMTKKEVVSNVRVQCAVDTCKDIAAKLQNQEEKIAQLSQQFQKDFNYNLAGAQSISQMPFEDMFKLIGLYLSHFNIYIKREFEGSNTGAKVDTDRNTQALELKRMHECLCLSMLDESRVKCELESWLELTNKLKSKSSSNMVPANVPLEIAILDASNDSLADESQLLEEQLLPAAVQEFVMMYIRKIIYEENKQKLLRRKQRLDKVTKLNSSLEEMVILAEFVWHLLQTDYQKATELQVIQEHFGPKFVNTNIEINARFNTMSKMIEEQQNQDPARVQLPWVECIMILLQSVTPSNLLALDPVRQYNQFLSNISQTEKQIFEEQLNQYQNTLEQMNKCITLFDATVYRDTTSQPIMIGPRAYILYRYSLDIATIQTQIKVALNTFTQEQKAAKTFPNYIRRLLWIWFLRAPKKMVMELANIRHKVQETKSTPFGLHF